MSTLQESNVLFRDDSPSFLALAGALDDVFWLAGADACEILYVSPAFERIWPSSCAELLRNPRVWLDALHPDDRPRVERAFATFLSARTGAGFDEQFRLTGRHGSVRWIRQRIVPIPAQADAPDRLLTLARDLTELKQAQQTLNDSNEKLLKLT